MIEPRCPYCQELARLVTGAELYPHLPVLAEHRFFRCDPCGAHVGTHRHNFEPLGTLANAELRSLRTSVHSAFDPIWHGVGLRKGVRRRNRFAAYGWLAQLIGVPRKHCHIASFDVARCRQVLVVLQFTPRPTQAELESFAVGYRHCDHTVRKFVPWKSLTPPQHEEDGVHLPPRED